MTKKTILIIVCCIVAFVIVVGVAGIIYWQVTKSSHKGSSPSKYPSNSKHPTKSPSHHKSPSKSPSHHKSPSKSPSHHKSPTKSPSHHKSPSKSPSHHKSPSTRSIRPVTGPFLENVIWHINNATGKELKNFPWDPTNKMKGRIKNFIVGIWPTWTQADYNNIVEKYPKYKDIIPKQSSGTGGIMPASDLIKLSRTYAHSIGANFIPYLLPSSSGFGKIDTAGDILMNLDGQMVVLKDVYGVDCQGLLLEQEANWGKDVTSTVLVAATRATWASSLSPIFINDNTKIAWYGKGPANNIEHSFPTKDSQITSMTGPSIRGADFTWPDTYEATWVGGTGHFTQPLVEACANPTGKDHMGCPVLPQINDKYGLFLESKDKPCCAGWSLLTPHAGRYCIPAEKWGPLGKAYLNLGVSSEEDLHNTPEIFVAAGPGGDLAIQYSGQGAETSAHPEFPKCIETIPSPLYDLVVGYNNAYGDDWKLRNGNSLALYG